jgi:hypothetical protein
VFKLKLADTVQAAVIGAVVYVVPARLPPQPETLVSVLPVSALISKLAVSPDATVADPGVIEPVPLPETDVDTVKVSGGVGTRPKDAVTVQAALIGPVV